MTRDDIVAKIAKNAEISKAASLTALKTVTESIGAALKKGERVPLVGFGTFMVRKSKARIGRNPKTGKELKIPARKRPVFKAGKSLKDAVK